MLVYEKSGPKGQIEWHRGYEIRLKHQILNRYLILGIFFFTKISTLHRTTSRSPKTFAPHLQQLLGKTAVTATVFVLQEKEILLHKSCSGKADRRVYKK